MKKITLLSFLLLTTVAFGQCIPASTSSSTYVNSFVTTGGAININSTASGYSSGGYSNQFTGTEFVSTLAGGSFSWTATIVGGTAGFAMWIDWNNDLTFTIDEVEYNTTSYGDGPYSGSVSVPSDSASGDYIIRIMVDWNDSNPDDNACAFASGSRGEVEDYKLTVLDPPSCLYPTDFVVSDITTVGATVAWSGGSTSSGNVVDFDASATFLGYMNWFELPANGGGYVNGSSWTVAALKSVPNTGANTLTLQPNFNTYAENPTDAYWVNQTTGAGNKNMQAATYVEDATANGTDLTFQGSVSSYTLDAAYTAKYFIKALDPANGWADVFGGSKTFDLPQSGNFSVSATAAELPAGLVVQYGFEVFGANANPADEVALGSVVVTASLDIWEYELVLAGATPTGVGISTTNNPLIITGCYDNTAYDVYVRLDCGGGDYSTWAGPVSFTTLCSTVTAYPDVTTFENNPPTACWYEANSGAIVDGPSNLGSAAWRSGTTYSDGTASVASNGINLYFNDVRDWLISPMYDLSVGDLSLIVNVAVTNWNSQAADNMGSDDEVNLLMSTDAGSSWTVLETWNTSNQPATNGTEFVYDLSGMSGTAQFAFMASDGTTNDSEDYDFHVGYMELTSALSVQEIELSQSLRVYPNPVTNSLTIQAQMTIKEIVVFNMLGQQMSGLTTNANRVSIDMSNYPTGIYFAKVTTDQGTETMRVMKQ